MGPPSPFDVPLKAVQETATDFSTDAVKWAERSTSEAAYAVGIALAAAITLRLIRALLIRLLGKADTGKTRRFRANLLRFVEATSLIFLTLLGCRIAAMFVKVPAGVEAGLALALMIATVVQVALWLRELMQIIIERRLMRQGLDEGALTGAVSVLNWLVNLVVWSMATLLLLDNLGVNITALVAGLGIGGLAVGLAAQGIMTDLFSALSIVFDRPFARGDFVVFGDKMGTVERIGLKNTRVRALGGEQIIVANNQLLASVIHNYRRMDERRVQFGFMVSSDTRVVALEKVPAIIRAAIEADKTVRFDRAHMTGAGVQGLSFEAVYYFKGGDYNPYMDAHQAILFRILGALQQEGIIIAPTPIPPMAMITLQRAVEAPLA